MFDIPNEELRPEHVPGPDAPWQPTIAEFALTFDGYEAMGGLDRLSTYAERAFKTWRKDGSLPRDLSDLRSCLFMEQRSVRWAENGPFPSGSSPEQFAYAHALIAAIRVAVENGSDAREGVRQPGAHNSDVERTQSEGVNSASTSHEPWAHFGSDPDWARWYTYYAVAGLFVRVRWVEDPPMPMRAYRSEDGRWISDETLWQRCFGPSNGWPDEPALDEVTVRALAAKHNVPLEDP